MIKPIVTAVSLFLCLLLNTVKGQSPAAPPLPTRGFCAHRGAMQTHPENTLAALKAAIAAGAHMIEFDVQRTKDDALVLMHDSTVDRTSNGSGAVAALTLVEIKKLDAGSWKSPAFINERVPTLQEALDIMPANTWLNIHVKGNGKLAAMVAAVVQSRHRTRQSFLACDAEGAKAARQINPSLKICNMDRKESTAAYVNSTLDGTFGFIQLRGDRTKDFPTYTKALKEKKVRINYYHSDNREEISRLFKDGVDFILCNDIVQTIKLAGANGILPNLPVYP